MRNIEEIAAEEEARIQGIVRTRLKKFLIFSSMILWTLGWYFFAVSQKPPGALLVFSSFIFLLAAFGLLKAFPSSTSAWMAALGAGGVALGFYYFTKCPSFYWGRDPAFWLAVDAGAVVEPLWSPLSYLAAQTICGISMKLAADTLPLVSPLFSSLCVFFITTEWFPRARKKNLFMISYWLLTTLAMIVSRPFWNTGTLASGLVAVLGLLFFLWQRAFLNFGEKSWGGVWLLSGLLFSVHPLWGFLGLIQMIFSREAEGIELRKGLPAFIFGLTPYLWVTFRAGHFFPSWGGSHPFREWIRQGKGLGLAHFRGDWSLEGALQSLGWTFWTLVFLTAGLLFWRKINGFKSHVPPKEWFLLGLAFLGTVCFFSVSSETPGPSAVFLPVGLGGILLRGFEKGFEKKVLGFYLRPHLKVISMGILLAGMGVAWMSGQSCFRDKFLFPQQHALNLLETLGPKSILACEDPFEANGCLEARLMEPVPTEAVILEKRFLNQQWYLSESILHAPEILFSAVHGIPDRLFNQLIVNNQAHWEVHWALSQIPPDWKGPKASSMILTQRFSPESSTAMEPEKIEYRYDLTSLLRAESEKDTQTLRYIHRYSEGFNELGKELTLSKNYSAAIRIFERSASLNPQYQAPRDYLSQIYSQQNILEAAQLEFKSAINILPGRIQDLMAEMEASQKNKNELETAGLLDELVRLKAELSDAEYHLAMIYKKQGRLEESKSLLEASVGLNPQRVETQMSLGRLMSRMGNRIKAEEAFRSVLTLDPQNKDAQKELWKLLNQS